MLRGMSTVNLNVRVEAEVIDRIDTLCSKREPRVSRNAMAAYLIKLAVTGGAAKVRAAVEAADSESSPAAPPERAPAVEGDGARLHAQRQRAGLTQKRVSEAVGVSEDAVRRVELGQRALDRYPSLLAWVEGQERAQGGAP